MELKKLKPVVNSDSWDLFLQWIDEELLYHYKFLINEKDSMLIYRGQGAIHELMKLKNLREKVNADSR